MTTQEPAPFGTWITKIDEEFVIDRIASTIDEVLMDPRTSAVYCLQSRPTEEGRGVLVRVGKDGVIDAQKAWYDVTPKGSNVGTGVHEYGGTAATVFNGTAYFSNRTDENGTDGRVYKVVDDKNDVPKAITLVNERRRFAGLAVHPEKTQFIAAIVEDHSTTGKPQDVTNRLCVINAAADPPVEVTIIVQGSDPTQDFYGPPAFSPNGEYIAWQQWILPNMPWDEAKICVAKVNTNSSFTLDKVWDISYPYPSPKPAISLAYPNWSDEKTLIFTSDQSDFLNPWKYDVSTPDTKATAVFDTPDKHDFGCPMWSLHFFPFAVLDKQYALFIGSKDGRDTLYAVDLKNKGPPCLLETGYDQKYVVVDGLRLWVTKDETFRVVFAGTTVDEETNIIAFTVAFSYINNLLQATVTDVKSADKDEPPIPKDQWISTPLKSLDHIPGYDGDVYIVFYEPKNPNYIGLPDEKPPCMVHVHGGPEWLQPQGLDWTKQYFTSRGWAWVDVNYGGSSGYGRKYRERLLKHWGLVDTDDCIASVQELSRLGRIDPKRVSIRGGSAGGFTTYAALAYGRYQGVFAAGTSIYGGVADLASLATKGEKFELRYTEKFVGGSLADIPWIYEQRSPLTYAKNIKVPLMILHGEKDPVVSVAQARDMYQQGESAHIQIYKGEGHHFSQAEHIKDALRKERDCYESALKLKGLTPI